MSARSRRAATDGPKARRSRPAPTGIFLSYRRRDMPGHAGRLADRLSHHFGHERLFVDVDSIGAGVDYWDRIERAVAASGVMVVVIGPSWDPAARLADPNDVVRHELDRALAAGIAILPVLVSGAQMPDPDDLPEAVRAFGRRNTMEIDDTRFADDADRLIAAIDGFAPRRRRARLLLGAAVVALVAAIASVAVVSLAGDDDGSRIRADGDTVDPDDLEPGSELSLDFGPGGSTEVPTTRRWTFTPGAEGAEPRLTNVLVLRNTTDVDQPFVHYEVVPKVVASDIAQITFTPSFDEVIDPDPVVAFRRTLTPKGSLEISWSVTVTEDVTADLLEEWRDRLVADQSAFLATLPATDPASGVAVLGASTAPAAGDAGVSVTGGSGGSNSSAGGGTAAGNTGGDAGSGDGSSGDGGSGTTGTTAPFGTPSTSGTQANRAPVLQAISNRSNDEQAAVNVQVFVSDADGDTVNLVPDGLPAGLTLSNTSFGGVIQGTIAVDAVSATTQDTTIKSGTFSVTVTASDGKAAPVSRTFTWTVRDTHLLMPNYIGLYGCGACGTAPDEPAPDVSHTFEQQIVGTWRSGVSFADSTVWRQGVAPGTTVAWGQPMQFWYWNTSCPSTGGCVDVEPGYP